MGRALRVAIAHDYLTQRGGAERVVLAIARAFPDAPIYTTLYEPGLTYPDFEALDVRASPLNRVPFLRARHRAALPLLPWVSSRIKIDADVVIASSSGWAHGFSTTGRMLVYCYSPARWLYESETYLGAGAPRLARAALRVASPVMRRWDRKAAADADTYLAISTVTKARIQRQYGIDAEVVPAPHHLPNDTSALDADATRIPARPYFLVVSRLLPYKNVDAIVDAMRLLEEEYLVVVGTGPEKAKLSAGAPDNVTFLEGLSEAELVAAYRGCTVLVAASYEDFGLTPIEAAAHGRPSVVLRGGGFLDTVTEGQTGVFFSEPSPPNIAQAIRSALAQPWDDGVLRRHAGRFSEERFITALRSAVDQLDSTV